MDQIQDASSFFLWEDSADSEVDRLLSHPEELESAVDDQEDARSCSCDANASDQLRALDFQDDGDGAGDQAVGSIGDDGPDRVDERRWSGTVSELDCGEEEEEQEESSNNVGLIGNTNEMEDKLFWDTCMAGGYP